MGLDMYFSRRFYVKNWDHMAPSELHHIRVERDGKPVTYPGVISYIETEVGYFRKFNALHGHIVNRYAGGVDECQPIELGRKAIEEIHGLLKDVIDDEASDLLPPTAGFFFGSTAADEWYWADVEKALEMFQGFLDDPDCDYVMYQASW